MMLAVISTEAQASVTEIFLSYHKWPIFPYGVYGKDKLLDMDFLEKTQWKIKKGDNIIMDFTEICSGNRI